MFKVRVALLKSTDMSFVNEDERVMKRVIKRCWLGDWFLITQVNTQII